MKNQKAIDEVGALIRQARSKQDLSKQQLADKCGIGKSNISKAENDIKNVSLPILRTRIEKGLGGRLQIALEF